MKKILLIILSVIFVMPTYAMLNNFQLRQMIGWTIIASKTIEGHITEDGKRSDDFEGCDFDMQIVFTDGKAVTCTGYGYQYAYRPTAIIFAKSVEYKGKNLTMMKMLVQGQFYDVR
ncbi:hypothetical protein [Nitrosococcus oceani]|uniref:hypothetical protein n=1 Tax=Nitrosococcus oceani TaxID=1229 RepID=UPI0004E8FBB6|nr:hypothetical protein [Nitrosococcus oceani]KFI23725.1 hypothetical protein HW44_02150 [Nitrosococcus oceani]